MAKRCPCSTGLSYEECCEPLHAGARRAPTAEALMRSRFAAYALGARDYLLDTWHVSTRPAALDLDDSVRFTSLDILTTSGGGPFDTHGNVTFDAYWRSPSDRGVQHENSRFVREDRWYYLDGV